MIGNNSYGDTIVGGDSVITLLINDKMSFYRYAVPSGDVSFYLEFRVIVWDQERTSKAIF